MKTEVISLHLAQEAPAAPPPVDVPEEVGRPITLPASEALRRRRATEMPAVLQHDVMEAGPKPVDS